MTNEERALKASELKSTGKCNCCQAVLKIYEDKINVDDASLMTLGAGYAAGMGCMESTCGALIGAVMVAGFLTGGKGTPSAAKSLVNDFKAKSGALICKELKGIETGKVLCECKDCVKHAVEALERFE